jgi:hypothetical protein
MESARGIASRTPDTLEGLGCHSISERREVPEEARGSVQESGMDLGLRNKRALALASIDIPQTRQVIERLAHDDARHPVLRTQLGLGWELGADREFAAPNAREHPVLHLFIEWEP